MKKWIPFIFLCVLGAVTATVLSWRQHDAPASPRQIVAADIPPGTVFHPISETRDFEISPTLRILRDPDSPDDGIAAVKIMVTSKIDSDLRNVQAAVWLPPDVLRFTPMGVIGTNTDMWDEDLTPKQPKMGLLGSFRFRDFGRMEQIATAFQGPTRIKIIWDKGVRYLQFPADTWTIEIVE